MLKLYKKVIVIASMLLISSESISDVFQTSDLIPIEPNKSIFEFGYSIYDVDKFPLTISNTFEKIEKNETLDVGYITSNEWTLGVEGKIKSHSLIKPRLDDKYEVVSGKVSILMPSFLNVFQTWKNKVSFGISHIPDGELYCYETIEFVIGGNENSCSKKGKKLYISEDNGYSVPAIKFNSFAISSGLGLKKHKVNWNNKTTYEINIQNYYIENNINFGSGFKTINKTDLINIPQKDPFSLNELKVSAFHVREIFDNWAFGSGITAYIIQENNFKNKKFEDNINFSFNSKLTKNYDNRYYISIGGILSTNSFLDIENILLNHRSEKLFNSSYGEIKLKFGFFNKPKASIFDNLKPLNLKKIKKDTIKKVSYKENFLMENKKHNIKTNSNENLKGYALSFAREYDNVNYTIF